MDIQKISIKSTGAPRIFNSKQNIENDIVLPDYYDKIGKLIKCSVTPFCENTTAANDKISVSGCAEICVLYIGEDNLLYKYENIYKYTKIIQCENIELSDCIDIKQECISLNYHITGPKRIEIRAKILVSAEVIKNENTEIISRLEENGLYSKSESIDILMNNNLFSGEFNISNSGNPLIINDNIKFFLRKDCSFEVSEIKAINNKLYLKGNATVTMVYMTEVDSAIKKSTVNLPVSEVIDYYGLEEGSVCEILKTDAYISLNCNSSDGDKSIVDINISMKLLINSYIKENISFISDTYSIDKKFNSDYIEMEFIKNSLTITKNLNISFETDPFENEDFSVVDAYLSNAKISYEISDNKINCILNGEHNALIRTENNRISIIQRNHSEEFSFDNTGYSARSADLKVLSISALQTSDRKIRFNADVLITLNCIDFCKEKMLSTIFVSDENEIIESSLITLYFAQKGESVWNIAKENRSCIESIKDKNSINGDIIDKDSILVFSDF